MIENYRTQRVWQLFMQNAEVQRGLQRAGFVPLPFMALNLQPLPAQGAFDLSWNASASRLLSSRILAGISSPGRPRPGSSKPPTAERSIGSTPGHLRRIGSRDHAAAILSRVPVGPGTIAVEWRF